MTFVHSGSHMLVGRLRRLCPFWLFFSRFLALISPRLSSVIPKTVVLVSESFFSSGNCVFVGGAGCRLCLPPHVSWLCSLLRAPFLWPPFPLPRRRRRQRPSQVGCLTRRCLCPSVTYGHFPHVSARAALWLSQLCAVFCGGGGLRANLPSSPPSPHLASLGTWA